MEYISNLWHNIGYSPTEVHLDSDLDDEHYSCQVGGFFTSAKSIVENESVFSGVIIRSFRKEIDNGEIVEFLMQMGLSVSHKDDIIFKLNGTVLVNNLGPNECAELINAIHHKQYFGKVFFCMVNSPIQSA